MKSESKNLFSLILPFLILLLSASPAFVFAQTCIDSDGDGVGLNGDASCTNAGVDCDDTNNTVYPNAPLQCDGLDNNCDGNKDFMTDEDKDGDGVPWCAGDCNDDDPARYPGNQEGPFGDVTCSDGIDNDCDNRIDASDSQCQNICTDVDGDGYGSPGHSSCTNGSATDCNDNNATINPGATDINCDGVDNNCSGTADDGYIVTPTNCGVGECAASGQLECQSGVEVDTCVSGAPVAESPIGSPECSDGADNDCDGMTDGADPGCAACTDNDGDGYGSNGDITCLNGPAVDCNDNDSNVNPGATDTNCNGVDDNCSGTADDGYVVTPTNCGVGACTNSGQVECQGGVEADTCVPFAAGTEGPYPGPTCSDGIDNDCDGLTDTADISDCSSLDVDDDGDTFTENQGDCDDTNNTVYPNAQLQCDGLDNNCDGNKDFMTDEDKDGDGVPWCAGDCNDDDPARYPGNQEGPFGDVTCSDGIDNDCDNRVDASDSQCQNICTDVDGDGYGSPGHSSCSNGIATDCNDNDININPGAADINCNGVDDNCTGTADDGYIVTPTNCGVGECAASGQLECQSGAEVDTCVSGAPVAESPIGSPECSDGADNDCDGMTDGADPGCAACTDNDGDGYGSNGDITCLNGPAVDCNDNDSNVNPGATDTNCNGVDDNCSGTADDGYVVTPTNCGVGACTNSGQVECQGGVEADTCVPFAAGTEGPYPGPTCSDGIDNDCDGFTDTADISDCSSLDVDDDGDTFTENQGDCDDTNNTVYPAAPLLCDGLDNNCDGNKDFMTDEDKDGDGVAWCAGDCNDDDPAKYPGNQEGPFGDVTCSDGIDNDCDNRVDALDSQCQNICTDVDGDGYGSPGHSSCSNGVATDCNDNDATINPEATDANCDGVDDNCTGTADDGYVGTPTNCGVGSCAANGQFECQGGVEVDNCVPGAPVVESPTGSPECGDGADNDCDGLTDGADPGCAPCTDNDGDGYGSNGDITCVNGTEIDCNDNDSNINPGASDANCNGIDEDCVGGADSGYVVTLTNCGVGACTNSGQLECQSGVEVDTCVPFAAGTEGPYPGPTCEDGIDNDCDGLTDTADISDCSSLDVDDDGDTFTENQGDCDDTNNTVYPAAPLLCDGLDNNCDGNKDFTTDEDKDGDGVPWCDGDCDDNDPARYPGNQEGPRGDATCSDGIDNDCDNNVDILDSACAPPSCNTKFAPQDGTHIFDLLDPADDSVIASPCSWCHTDVLLGTGTTDQRVECQRCHADPGDTSDQLNGVLKDPINPNAYPGNPPYGFGTALNVKLHSSSVVGTKYGNWDMDCLTCHNPHQQEQDIIYGTGYGKYIREYICFDNPATGLNIEEIVEFTAATGAGSFTDGAPYNENICEMCHTQTTYHRNDGSTATHNDGTKCTNCHLHSDGFLPVAKSPHNTKYFNDNCQLCHVETGGVLDLSATIPDANCKRCHGERTSHTSDITRNKFASGNYVYDFTCVDCHDPMTTVGNNRKLLRESIAASVIPGSFVSNTTRIGIGSLADGPPRNENICETCHFLTSHNRGDGSGDGVHDDSVNYDDSYCMLCHDHNRSFMIPGPSAEE